jgi:hypothetical protein
VDFGDSAGLGFENQTPADVAVPFLGLLQALSPQVTDGNPTRIAGAKQGDLLNTVTQELLGSPVHVVPCCSEHVYVEWRPREQGGGFVAVHAVDDPIIIDARAKAEKPNKLKTNEGNDLVETFYIYGLLLDSADAQESGNPIVIAFTSTKIKVYRRLMTALRTIKGKAPMCAYRIAIGSVDARNHQNQPYKNFDIKPTVGTSYIQSMNLPTNDYRNLLAEGQALVKAVRGGLARLAFNTQPVEEQTDGDAPF